MNDKTILIMAGGTGGHIFPGLAVAAVLQTRGWRVVWLGNPAAMEGRLVAAHGIPLEALHFAGLRSKGWRAVVKLPLNLLQALVQARRIFKKVRPTAVLGMGGYMAFPGGVVARLLGCPLVVHEQNSVAGMANRVLARLARQVLQGFPSALPNASWVGNPIRASFGAFAAPARRYAERTGALRIAVIGGSLGAAVLNEIVPRALALLAPTQRPLVVHQAGAQHLEVLQTNYRQAGVLAECIGFVDDMATLLAGVDLVICRAGAMTVSEIAGLGVAALFVPYPYAVDDHQTSNAQFLVRHGGGWSKPQQACTAEWLADWLRTLDRPGLQQAAEKAHALAKPKAADAVADAVERAAI
jgi:UDP-N-acetylglucosamine--N-acetylmuramyl-(pentapeptide) pyrophosphoryl-undecaprenol N-acetylglucosamine transferase